MKNPTTEKNAIPNCETDMNNTACKAIRKAQEAFSGAAEMMGVNSEEDIQALVNEVRWNI